jgi:tRNA dimethylallyltransferase
MIRALEVFRITGRPISAWQRETTHPFEKGQEVILVGLTCDRDSLHAQVEARIDRWLEAGWLQEAEQLHRRPLSRTAREALGYRELFQFIEGRSDWETTVSSIKQNSRQYAKRQWTWFKADPRIEWIEVDGLSPKSLAEKILNQTPAWNGPSS